MKKAIVIMIGLVTFLGSCKNSQKKGMAGKGDKAGLIVEMPVFTDDFTTVKVQDIPETGTLNMETIFDSVSFVKLSNEPQATIGGIDQLVVRDSLMVIRDCYGTKSVKLFSMTGEYIGNIGGHGRGPGEYIQPTFMQVTDDGIVIWDQYTQKLSFYNWDGKFSHTVDIPFFV